MCLAKSYTQQLLSIYENIELDINRLCREEKMANMFDQDMLNTIENTNFNACAGYKLAKQLRENRLFRRQVKNELDTLLRLKTNIVDTTYNMLNDQHQKIILRNNYLKGLVENKIYTPKVMGVENPEIKVKSIIRDPKSDFIPILVPSIQIQTESSEIEPNPIQLAIHKKTKCELQIINKIDDDHYLVKDKVGQYHVLLKKNISNLECLQTAK